METTMNTHKSFIYLIKITLGPKIVSVLVKNSLPVPEILLETMAKELITKYINDSFPKEKHYQVQTSDQYFNKMIKQSSFDIEDLNEIDVYDLQLKFKDGTIVNRLPEEKESTKQTRKEKINGKEKRRRPKEEKIESAE